MSSVLLPTTRAQVSGHRFLRRRVQHGLVFGDVRMIHDPLRSRERGLVLGLVACVLAVIGAALLAWVNPQPDPGDASVLKASDGSLFVRVDGRLHPVANLASARLIAGEPVEPVSVGDEALASKPKGAPVGLHPAPAVLSDSTTAPRWAACVLGDKTIVATDVPTRSLTAKEAMLVDAPGRTFLVTAQGRREVHDDPFHRVILRAIGADARTPHLKVPAPVVSAIAEQPAFLKGVDLSALEILRTAEGDSVANTRGTERAVVGVSPLQSQILVDLGVKERSAQRGELSTYRDATPVDLPTEPLVWFDGNGLSVCARDDGTVGLAEQTLFDGAAELPTGAAASHFVGLSEGAVAVDTGAGFFVITPSGMRHEASAAALEALGFTTVHPAPWGIIALLPAGPELSADAARRFVVAAQEVH